MTVKVGVARGFDSYFLRSPEGAPASWIEALRTKLRIVAMAAPILETARQRRARRCPRIVALAVDAFEVGWVDPALMWFEAAAMLRDDLSAMKHDTSCHAPSMVHPMVKASSRGGPKPRSVP